MVVCNFKIKKSLIIKILAAVISIGIISMLFLNNINRKSILIENSTNDDPCINNSEVAHINSSNYTNILKEVHENINTYVGQKICFDGYIYRIDSFKSNQFVLARDMDIGNHQSLVVGFLCEYDKISNFENYSWVTITGTIKKGTYNNTDIPILEITEIYKSEKPESASVPVPNTEYVPTSVIY